MLNIRLILIITVSAKYNSDSSPFVHKIRNFLEYSYCNLNGYIPRSSCYFFRTHVYGSISTAIATRKDCSWKQPNVAAAHCYSNAGSRNYFGMGLKDEKLLIRSRSACASYDRHSGYRGLPYPCSPSSRVRLVDLRLTH